MTSGGTELRVFWPSIGFVCLSSPFSWEALCFLNLAWFCPPFIGATIFSECQPAEAWHATTLLLNTGDDPPSHPFPALAVVMGLSCRGASGGIAVVSCDPPTEETQEVGHMGHKVMLGGYEGSKGPHMQEVEMNGRHACSSTALLP